MIRTALKFGTFVLVCIVFTAYLGFTIGNRSVDDPLDRANYELTATFDDVTGLLLNDNVKIAGVKVGKVTGITTDDGRAVVTMQIDDDHAAIPNDSFAAVRWRNLIGQRYVYLYPGTSSQAFVDGDVVCPPGSGCTNRNVIDLGELFNKLGPIVGAIDPEQVNALLETFTQALDGREDKVGQALDDLATLTTALASRDDAIQRLITNLGTVADTVNARDAQIEQMLENLIVLADTFSDNTATIDAALDELTTFGTELDQLLDVSSDELDRILTHLAQVTDSVHGKLPELDAFLAQFGDASAAIFRAGSYGEFLNQKILCAFVGPPVGGSNRCPVPAIKGLDVLSGGSAASGSAPTATAAPSTPVAPTTTTPAPVSGAGGITSLLEKVLGS